MEEKGKLGEILQKRFSISRAQWQECLKEQEKTGLSLVRIITEKGLANEENLLECLSQQLKIPYVKISAEDIDSRLIKSIPAKFVTHYNFVPIQKQGNTLKIAINDPLDVLLLDEIKLFLKQEVSPVIASRRDILDSIKNAYGLGADTLEKIAPENVSDLEVLKSTKDEDIRDETIDPSVIKFLNQVLLDAIKQRATDIHLEPSEDDLRIRYRVDGILYEIPCPATIKHFQSSIASRIKVMANLDIAEKRRPQDGRLQVRMGEEVFDLRVSILPTPFGESIGMRILSRRDVLISLEQLGLESVALSTLEKMINKPYGIILVTGPTGSGKTTTLYACLSKINSVQRKILTIEEPIEYQLKGITQMQVEPKVGFTFANALRSMLRHDPDVMMIGEIRDTQTAELSVRTALTGHLVFSTLHTNDAASSVTRLLDMGIDSYLVSSSVVLVIAQRLVRLICPNCKEKFIPPEKLIKEFGEASGFTIFHGRGCESCRLTGYQGRTGIFETMVITDEIREMSLKKLPAHQIKQKAVSLGMKTLKQAGWDKVKQGLTTLEEVLRVTQEEET
ncbi:GspE/PulE family protein [Candidatus Omnitrophota bacterium]